MINVLKGCVSAEKQSGVTPQATAMIAVITSFPIFSPFLSAHHVESKAG
jgi:hypothetical protein